MSGGGGGGEYDVDINLTALLDVLTNLLFFLMMGFAAQRASIELDADLILPDSIATTENKPAVRVNIGKNGIKVEQETVATLQGGKLAAPLVDGRIDPLYRKLNQVRQKRPPAMTDAPDVLFLVCDKTIPYGLIRQVMVTGAEAGFPKFRLAVMAQ
jgi:biopolymer transport protein ExbD